MRRSLIMKDHHVGYTEYGLPLWFILVYVAEYGRIEIVLVGGQTEEEVRKRVEDKGEILKVVQLWSLLDRARIIAGVIRNLG